MKKRKTFVIIIAMLMVALFMSACGSSETDRESKDITEDEKDFGTFVVISKEEIKDSDIFQYILYDPETMVMWTFMDGYKCGGPSVLYNADGTLRLYEP